MRGPHNCVCGLLQCCAIGVWMIFEAMASQANTGWGMPSAWGRVDEHSTVLAIVSHNCAESNALLQLHGVTLLIRGGAGTIDSQQRLQHQAGAQHWSYARYSSCIARI
jgi:hypothetical protein